QPNIPAVLAPTLGGSLWIGKQCWAIHDDQRPSIDANVAFVTQSGFEVLDESQIILRRMSLADEHLALRTIPSACPVLVRPADAKWEVEFPVLQHLFKGPLQQALTTEP